LTALKVEEMMKSMEQAIVAATLSVAVLVAGCGGNEVLAPTVESGQPCRDECRHLGYGVSQFRLLA
jgi:hypothetical protein